MSNLNRNGPGVAGRLAGNVKSHKTNKQTFPNKQSRAGVVSNTRTNNIDVTARRGEGGKIECTIQRLTVVLEGGSTERVTNALDKSHFGGSSVLVGNRPQQKCKSTSIRRRRSGSRLRSNCYENSGLCQVLDPTNIDRSRKVRDEETFASVSSLPRLGSPRLVNHYVDSVSVGEKCSVILPKQTNLVLRNISQSRNLQQSSKDPKVGRGIQSKACHLLQPIPCRLQHKSDVNVLLNRNNLKSNGTRCNSESGLKEKKGRYPKSGRENGNIKSMEVEKSETTGKCRNRDENNCYKSGSLEKKSEKVFLDHSFIAGDMESDERRGDKNKRGLKASKIAVLSKSSGQRKSVTPQRFRSGDTSYKSRPANSRVVSVHKSVCTSLPGNLLGAEITDRNGTDCKASRRREIGDDGRCASSGENITGLSRGKVFHSTLDSTQCGGVAGTNEVSLGDRTGVDTLGRQTTQETDDTAQHASRAGSAKASRKICQRSVDCNVIVRDKRTVRRKEIIAQTGRVGQGCVISDNAQRDYGEITTGLESPVCAVTEIKYGQSVNNGELSVVCDSPANQPLVRGHKQGNISHTDRNYDSLDEQSDCKNRDVCRVEVSHSNVTDRFQGGACLSNNKPDDVASSLSDGFRVCEKIGNVGRSEGKATQHQKQLSGIPSYQGAYKYAKAPNVKKKKLLNQDSYTGTVTAVSDGNEFGESVEKTDRDDTHVSCSPGSTISGASKSLKHKVHSTPVYENGTKKSACEYNFSEDGKIYEESELLLVSDSVSYLVTLSERDTSAQTDKNSSPSDTAICESSAPENLAETDAGGESLGTVVGTGFPRRLLSVGDKERKAVGSNGDRLLGSSSKGGEKFLVQSEHCVGTEKDGSNFQDINSFETGERKNHSSEMFSDFNHDRNYLVHHGSNYCKNSDTEEHCEDGINNYIPLHFENGGIGNGCITHQASIKCDPDQNKSMATKASGPVKENMRPSQQKSQGLKRQTGHASLDINLAEKKECGSGKQLAETTPSRKRNNASASRLMRPTISSAIKSSPEMAKKLIPMVKSPTSPDTMFSPPMERKNKEWKKNESSGKMKLQTFSSDIVAHKPLQVKSCDKVLTSPRSSVSSTDVSVPSCASEKESEISSSGTYQKHRNRATKTTGVAPKMHQSAKSDSSKHRSKKCRTVKVDENLVLEEFGQTANAYHKQSGAQKSCSREKGELKNNSITSNEFTEKVESCDIKVEKTRRNVETYENCVESGMDSNRSSSEREYFVKDGSLPQITKMNSLKEPGSEKDEVQSDNKVIKNMKRDKIGEKRFRNTSSISNKPDLKLHAKKTSQNCAKPKTVQNSNMKVTLKKKKDSGDCVCATEPVVCDTVQRGGSLSPTLSATSTESKSGKPKQKASTVSAHDPRNIRMERVPSRVTISVSASQKKGTEIKSVKSIKSVSEDRKDKAKTVKKTLSPSSLKNIEMQSTKNSLRHKVQSGSKCSSSNMPQHQRSVSNSPRSSVVDDDTDSVLSFSSATSKMNKSHSKLPRASRLPSTTHDKGKGPTMGGKHSDKTEKSGSSVLTMSGVALKTAEPAGGNNRPKKDTLNYKEAVCDVQCDSKPTLKKKNLKDNINRKQRELSPLTAGTDCSEYSMLEEVIPSISDYDTDRMDDSDHHSHGPADTKTKMIDKPHSLPASDQSTVESKKLKTKPKSLTSPKVELRKSQQGKFYSKKTSPSLPRMNSKTSPGSPKSDCKKSPLSPAQLVKSGTDGSPRGARTDVKTSKTTVSKLPKKSGLKKSHIDVPNSRSLLALEQRYTAERLELMRLKIPAEMDFSDVSRPSTREGSVDSRFDDDRWSICSDISSVSRASSISKSNKTQTSGSKVPRIAVPSSRIKPASERLSSKTHTTVGKSSLPTKQLRLKGKSATDFCSSSETVSKKVGSKHTSPTGENLQRNKYEKLDNEPLNSVGIDNRRMHNNLVPSLSRGENLADVSTPVIQLLDRVNECECGSSLEDESAVPVEVNVPLILESCRYPGENTDVGSGTLTASNEAEEIMSDSTLPADSRQGQSSEHGNVNHTANISKHRFHSQKETHTNRHAEVKNEGQYGALSPSYQMKTSSLREGQEEVPMVHIKRTEENLKSITHASALSDGQMSKDSDGTFEASLEMVNLSCYQADSLLSEMTGEGEYLSSEAAGQGNQEPALSGEKASAVCSQLMEPCTLSSDVDRASVDGSFSDNIYRHNLASENANNKHLHQREGGVGHFFPHPTEFTSSSRIVDSEFENPDPETVAVIEVSEDTGSFLGACDGMLLKLSQVKEIKAEEREDSNIVVPMAAQAKEDAGFSLTKEFMGCDKNGEDSERQFDKNDKISINKLVHISGNSDKPEQGCTTETAGSSDRHTAYDSSGAQENFDTFKPETETVLACALQGRDGRVIRDTGSPSSHRLGKVQGTAGDVVRSSFNSEHLDWSSEGQNSGDISASIRLREEAAEPLGGWRECDSHNHDWIDYDTLDEGKTGYINESTPKLDLVADKQNWHVVENMESCEMSDIGFQGIGSHDDMEFASHIDAISTDICSLNKTDKSLDEIHGTSPLYREKHGHYRQENTPHPVSMSPDTERTHNITGSQCSNIMSSTPGGQISAGFETEVNYNVSTDLLSMDGNKPDNSSTKKCDSQTLGRMWSARSDKLSAKLPERRLVIDKRNLHPEGYNENMPIQRRIVLNPDSKVVMRDPKSSGLLETVTCNHSPDIRLQLTVSRADGESSSKPASRLHTYKPVHKSELLKQSSVRKSLAARAQQKAITSRFSQDSVNKVKTGNVLMKKPHLSGGDKSASEDHTSATVPHVSSIEFLVKNDCQTSQMLPAKYDKLSLMETFSTPKSEAHICASDSEVMNITNYVSSSNDSDSINDTKEIGLKVEEDVIVESKENDGICEVMVRRKQDNAVSVSARFLTADDSLQVADNSLPLEANDNTSQADAIVDKAAVALRPDTIFSLMADGSVQTEEVCPPLMENTKTAKSPRLPPPVVSPKPKVSVSADGKIDLSYSDLSPCIVTPDEQIDLKSVITTQHAQPLQCPIAVISNEFGFEPLSSDPPNSSTVSCPELPDGETSAVTVTENYVKDVSNEEHLIPSSANSDSTENKFDYELTVRPTQTDVASIAPPKETSIDLCSFDRSSEISSPECPTTETVSNQALKRSNGTTSLHHWQTVKNKFLSKPSRKVSKEKVNIVPSAHGSVEKTIEEYEECLDKKLNTDRKDKNDEKSVESSRVSEIRRSLSERLTKSPHPETPPATPSPSPTRKYKWIRGEGGIWKKKFLSDSGESGSEYEDYAKEDQEEILAKLPPVNRHERNIDRESSSESEYKPGKEGGWQLLGDFGVDNEMETSASEVEDPDMIEHSINMDRGRQSGDNVVMEKPGYVEDNDGVCVEKVDFETARSHFNEKPILPSLSRRNSSIENMDKQMDEKLQNKIQAVHLPDTNIDSTCHVNGSKDTESIFDKINNFDTDRFDNVSPVSSGNANLLTSLNTDTTLGHAPNMDLKCENIEPEVDKCIKLAAGGCENVSSVIIADVLMNVDVENMDKLCESISEVFPSAGSDESEEASVATCDMKPGNSTLDANRDSSITDSAVYDAIPDCEPISNLDNRTFLDGSCSDEEEVQTHTCVYDKFSITDSGFNEDSANLDFHSMRDTASTERDKCMTTAGAIQVSELSTDEELGNDRFHQTLSGDTGLMTSCDGDISQDESSDRFLMQTMTVSEEQVSSDYISEHAGQQEADKNVALSESEGKFIPIEASPILHKKCVELNSQEESEDQVSISAAPSSENISISHAYVPKQDSVIEGEVVEQQLSEAWDTESEHSYYYGYENTDTTCGDEDLDTTVTDDETDDLCELVITEDLDTTVVGAQGGETVDLHIEEDSAVTPVLAPQGHVDMAYTPRRGAGRRYSYAGSTVNYSSLSGSSLPDAPESGYWNTRKAFWEKDSSELLAEISELEESFEAVEGTETEQHRSASVSPVKVAEHPGGTTPRRLHRKKSGRRSLSLPSGTLSYGDVKITYVDGHFVAEPPSSESETNPQPYTGSQSDTVNSGSVPATSSESVTDVNSNDDTLSILSDLSIRDELLSLLNQHLVDSDVFYNHPLDWNCNHAGSDSSSHSSQSSLAMMPASSTLPRRTGRDNDGNRPVSVDDIQLLRNVYLQEQCESQGDNEGQSHTRNYSFREAVNQDLLSDPRNGRRRLSVQDDKSERSRSKSPNFFQRMLSKRKSFSEKVAKLPQDEGTSRKDTSIVRRMSLKSLFKRKNRKGSDEPDSPPIAAFLKDEDIGAISSLPNSPFVSKRVQRVQTDPHIQIRRPVQRCPDESQSSMKSPSLSQSIIRSGSRPGLTRPDVPPRRRQSSSSSIKQGSLTDRSSGEYSICEFDIGADDRLTPRSSSPSIVDNERDATLLASPHSGDFVQSVAVHPNRLNPRLDQMSPQEFEKLSGKLVRGEITSSNSNDSGIQHDAVILSSCESLKVSPDTATPVNMAVKLRKTPSPKQERPKSDITVRWADLLEQVRETNITYRNDGQTIRKRPRPKSDLGGSTLLTDTMRAFGSISNLRPSDSLRSLRLVDGIQVELRRSGQEDRVLSAKLVKSRRMSTPHPIKTRADKTATLTSKSHSKAPVMVRSHSMPENLDKLHRKKNFLSLIGSDNQSLYSQRSGDDSSDESEYSVEFTIHDKCPSTRSSQMALATLDEMQEETRTFAEALWDHVTMDPDELGFRAGEQIRVTDMSDKDWWFGCTEQRRGWFPAAFVRLWVNQERFDEDMIIHDETEESPKLRNHGMNTDQGRANVVNEIIHAEREYVKHLRDVVEGYLKQAKKRPEMFPEEKISIIFGNIEEIYNFATKFLASLDKVFNKEAPHMSGVGEVFLSHSKSFEIYSDYCNNHPGSGEVVKELYRNKKYRHFFEACRLLQDMIEIPLEGFLLTPVQKICKYHLQLNELLKYTPPDHQDFHFVKAALDSMKKIATLINERKRKMESIEKIAMWQASVDDWEGDDLLQLSSELIYSGELNKINSSGWSQERYFFLFDHQLVYCKKDLLKKNGFCYKGRVDLDHSDIIPLADGKDAQYNVTVKHAWKIHDTMRDKWYLLVAKSDQVKQRWLKAFEDERKRVKDDQENNFNIPVHLKQTAIHNLKQKSHLAKPKGKRKAARSASLRHTKKDATFAVPGTLPRKKQQDSLGDINQSKKLTWFFLGQGKKK
ncbi:uncharacterized protein LOC124110386 isoform X3 [Haliotis rufescens]|uniref:uncharacterized protein LOC124110386 isoform X3 n=1 Tax=Haliotis rufescens TaxID=6454 RepID=UPI00201F2D7A|nr:uncharacterized protein LOC124110386 isoform X3 [Haliotis rufescens]